MKKLKRFLEFFEEEFTYDRNHIMNIMKKVYGFGDGVYQYMDEFEKNKDFFYDPKNDNDYAKEFNVYLKGEKYNPKSKLSDYSINPSFIPHMGHFYNDPPGRPSLIP